MSWRCARHDSRNCHVFGGIVPDPNFLPRFRPDRARPQPDQRGGSSGGSSRTCRSVNASGDPDHASERCLWARCAARCSASASAPRCAAGTSASAPGPPPARAPTRTRARGAGSSRNPREGLSRAERVVGQQGFEDRRPGGLQRHGAAQRLVEVGALVLIEHEDHDDAPLVRGVAGLPGGRVMADVQLADRHRLRQRLTHPDRDAFGPARRPPFLLRAARP